MKRIMEGRHMPQIWNNIGRGKKRDPLSKMKYIFKEGSEW